MGNEQDKEKLRLLDEQCRLFRTILKDGFGVEQAAIAIIIPVTEGWELRCNVNGNSHGVINLISSLVQQLNPEDFQTLLKAMQHAPQFALHRDQVIAPGEPGGKTYLN